MNGMKKVVFYDLQGKAKYLPEMTTLFNGCLI